MTKSSMLIRLVGFLALNFGALVLGSFFMGEGPVSDWYEQLDKAPWTPPGWVFGVAWTTVMLCFSVYLALLLPNVNKLQVFIGLYAIQWFLNVGWNPTFFYFHEMEAAFVIIIALTFLVGFLLVFYWSLLRTKSVLLLPYFVWLVIATSLNGYIVFNN